MIKLASNIKNNYKRENKRAKLNEVCEIVLNKLYIRRL